jgi:hypothetical protein
LVLRMARDQAGAPDASELPRAQARGDLVPGDHIGESLNGQPIRLGNGEDLNPKGRCWPHRDRTVILPVPQMGGRPP